MNENKIHGLDLEMQIEFLGVHGYSKESMHRSRSMIVRSFHVCHINRNERLLFTMKESDRRPLFLFLGKLAYFITHLRTAKDFPIEIICQKFKLDLRI